MNLFDIIDKEEAKEKPLDCKHSKENKTITYWTGYPSDDPRMTWTCLACGRIRGRCNE